MKPPRVFILLPSLNARAFLEARVDSLLAQTFTGWEALVLDSHSDDGTWEFFESVASRDPRFHLRRIPREGFYRALNLGIDLAQGDFLHIATCDDTMDPAFLQTMVAALDALPDAGVAVSDVQFIDEHGTPTTFNERLGSDKVRTATLGEEIACDNFRPPPHDCLLHFAGETVYCSLTQVVVRTALAREAPRFETTVGSVGDFGWSLNLASLAGTVHVPRKLATWRLHSQQLTQQPKAGIADHIAAMCRTGLERLCARHGALLSRNDRASLLVPSKILQAQAAGNRLRTLGFYLECLLRIAWMFLERPRATWSALGALKLRARYAKQAWVAFLMRRLRLAPRCLPPRP